MPLVKHFIDQHIKLLEINEYLHKELSRAGFSGVDLQKTPLGVRVTLKTSRPGLVIGKGGKRIQEITEVLRDRFGLEMPQIEVEEVKNADLDAKIMAERLAYSLDRGRHYRRAAYYILRKAMDSGARGIEIRIAGKLSSQRARAQIFREGVVVNSGMAGHEGVSKGVSFTITKTGLMGVKVRIMHADYDPGDRMVVKAESLDEIQKQKVADAVKKKATDAEVKAVEEAKTAVEKELLDKVDEEKVDEISLEPSKEKLEPSKETEEKLK